MTMVATTRRVNEGITTHFVIAVRMRKKKRGQETK
jgi:hypothetical protein